MKTLPELQQAAQAAEERSHARTTALDTLTAQAADVRTRIGNYTINDDMLLMAADQNRLGFLDRQIAKDTPTTQQAQQAAQDARAACEKAESEVWALQRRLAELLECKANWVRFEININTWQAEIDMTIQKLQLNGITPQVTSAPARPPLPEKAALITV
jgi:hypothetical protein